MTPAARETNPATVIPSVVFGNGLAPNAVTRPVAAHAPDTARPAAPSRLETRRRRQQRRSHRS